MRKLLVAVALGAAVVTTTPSANAISGANIAGVTTFGGVAEKGTPYLIVSADLSPRQFMIHGQRRSATLLSPAVFTTTSWPLGPATIYVDGVAKGTVEVVDKAP